MKILVITQKVDLNDPVLGFFHAWLKKLSQKAELSVIANGTGGYNLPQVQVCSLGKERGAGRVRRFFRYQRLLLEILPKVDGIFFHMCPEYVLAAFPVLFFIRRKSVLWYVHKSVSRKLWLAEKLVDKIFTASPESFRLPSKKVVITGHGIDTEHFRPLPRSERGNVIKLLAAGRVTPSKNLEFLLEVLEILQHRILDKKIILDIAGSPVLPADYGYQERIKALIETRGLGAAVAFLGPKLYDEMSLVYAEHDILLHASETGSIDKVVIEAMAAGLAVVSSSEAFYNLLPEKYAVREKNPAKMAEKVMVLKAARRDPMLREIVLKNHDLDKLLNLILNAFR